MKVDAMKYVDAQNFSNHGAERTVVVKAGVGKRRFRKHSTQQQAVLFDFLYKR